MKKYTNEELTENIINMLKEKIKKDYKKNHIKREAHSKMDPIWWTREKACLSIWDLFCTILTKR